MGADYTTMTPSREQWGKGYLLDLELLEWFLERYCPGEDLSDPRISVLLAESVVGHPPALVVTAGMDPHLDEGRAYANKLEEAGVEVERLHIGPMIHGFISFTGVLPKADSVTGEMIRKVGAYLRR
jgi:acetyl esterase